MSPETVLSPKTAARRFLCSLASPTRILVAISGGSDSTGLLLALSEALEAEPNSKISLCAATIDHDLRAESADEARYVAALCKSLDVPHATRVWRGPKPKTGIMAAAREARYELLADATAELEANLIVTAHTLDDQRETRAMRGARSDSLSIGIADAVLFDRRIWIARPFLSCLRADIRAFLSARAVPWFDDPSNEDLKYERVRTRATLAGEGAPEPEAGEADVRLELSRQAALWLDRHFTLPCEGLGCVTEKGLEAPVDVLRYALGRLAAVFGGQRFAPGRKQMDGILGFVSTGTPGRMTASRVILDLRRNGLYLARESRGILPLVVAPGECRVWDGRFEVRNECGVAVQIEAGATYDPSFLYLPQESGAPKSLGARDSSSSSSASFTARTRGGGIPVTSTGMREEQIKRLPKAALKRAIAASPIVLPTSGVPLSAESAPSISVTPYFAPFDRFLTRFDLIFAESLAAAFGTDPYPSPPLGLIDGKTI
ncbi:tRNA lysidine(34) synthetase TilS [Rhizobium sullae]|uniref:tRNA(Ile)-lysidine synthase n=1 Tax=Rhizobium sullae TaxID=50338 RepID=A0A2N0D693_RHISU|nr:tRNA lysidine(34) synthetase TilS [Rhizobium sullae]PKA41616.1 tRNA lysidine(34) synthetase TilS [Rhizobium sullae]UWU13311.1 tRNA lysidine(34) synthetase TilS [Rhizobium sullae]